jgi:LysM repeat protein
MKRHLGSILLTIVLTHASAGAKLTQPKNGISVTYTVQSGDTLYTIAHQHHTTIREVLEANGMTRDTVLKVGQTLKVPINTYNSVSKTTPDKSDEMVRSAQSPDTSANPTIPSGTKGGSVDYTVQSGDTLYTIARKHHTSIRELLEANNLKRDTVIKVGQHLHVPTNTYPPVNTATSQPTQISSKSTRSHKAVSTQSTSKSVYIVKPGDTLFSIARKNHIVLSKLMLINDIGLMTQLHAGQTLRIVEPATTAEKQVEKTTITSRQKLPVGAMPSYTVKKGDTLWDIAHKHHLTLAEIRRLNKMNKTDRIHAGMVLAVGKPVEAPKTTYTVQKGDTLWLIAKKNKMTTQQLRKLNGLKRKEKIHVGMVLALKAGAKHTVKTKATLKKHKRPTRPIQTPLRIAKKRKTTKSSKRFGSAMAMLNQRPTRSRSNNRVIRVAKRYLGRRYVWGAEGPRAFDCSGFTQYVLRKSKGVRLPRVSRKQAYYGKYVSRSHLRPGDLVFFDTSHRRRGYVNHVGIYIGNNKFIHASSARHRVVITSLNRPFYRARFKWGRRVN